MQAFAPAGGLKTAPMTAVDTGIGGDGFGSQSASASFGAIPERDPRVNNVRFPAGARASIHYPRMENQKLGGGEISNPHLPETRGDNDWAQPNIAFETSRRPSSFDERFDLSDYIDVEFLNTYGVTAGYRPGLSLNPNISSASAAVGITAGNSITRYPFEISGGAPKPPAPRHSEERQFSAGGVRVSGISSVPHSTRVNGKVIDTRVKNPIKSEREVDIKRFGQVRSASQMEPAERPRPLMGYFLLLHPVGMSMKLKAN